MDGTIPNRRYHKTNKEKNRIDQNSMKQKKNCADKMGIAKNRIEKCRTE